MNGTSVPGGGLPPFSEETAVALLDTRGVVSGWTPEARALLGRSAADVVGRPARALLANPLSWPALVQAYAQGERRGEAVLRTGGGDDLPVVFKTFGLNGGDGHGGAREHRGHREHRAGDEAWCLVLAAPAALATRWNQDRAFINELFLQDRVGLAVFDPGLRLLRTNTHLLPYTGVPPDLRGRRLSDFLWPGDAAPVEAQLRGVLRTGRPLVGAEQLLRTVEDPAGGVFITISAFRLQAPDGRVLGLTALFTDVTELRRSGERLALLHHATASVSGSLSVKDTCAELAAALVPGLADLAVVEIADTVSSGEEPLPDGEGRLVLRRTAVAGQPAEGDGPRASSVARVAPPIADTGTGTGGYPMTMTALLRARGLILGRVSVGRHADRGLYEKADHDLLREIADRAALALDNARRFAREHRAAVGLQRAMLPPRQTETVAATTSGTYLPANTSTGVGGDWFDVIPLSSARVALVVGDVVGHGLAATATMGRLRTAVRTLADLDLEPDELLTHLDDLVAQLVAEPEDPADEDSEDDGRDAWDDGWRDRNPSTSTGATCAYAIYDPVSRTCVVASAGHPPPAVADPQGNVSYLPVDPGPPLGVGGLPFETTEADVAPGTVIALYTNGLIENRDGDLEAGMAELAGHLARPGALGGSLRDLGREIVAGRPAAGLGDDVTVLLARTRAVPAEDVAAWEVEADPAAVGTMRETAAAHLRTWGLEELAFTTELVLTELVTNAIRYAGGPVRIRLIRAGRLICEVSDPSATHPRMRRARLTDEGGRGLYLVAQLTTRWGSRYSRSGKTIWAEQEFGPPA
ncbi:SpoIIE family protein phosphatase [Streptomyces sp. P9(2023)]|uniref:SpoIIE family protein phosphatase n=1 Tax=Streptomyces sp. P9(2023) TaxID=3064394 RepID=UPI0028F4153A|nr:SpoIIE family protein phosphatase [Streptomyces sp. P9(2023)]MDT9688925.1 SpoIIE family protein phosphatase [Streptomyces sp. P9(2023)]